MPELLAQAWQLTNETPGAGFVLLLTASVRGKNESQAQDRPVVAHMEIFDTALWDEAGSGGEGLDLKKDKNRPPARAQ